MTSDEIRQAFIAMGLKSNTCPCYKNAEDYGHKLRSRNLPEAQRVVWETESGVTFTDLQGSINTGYCHA